MDLNYGNIVNTHQLLKYALPTPFLIVELPPKNHTANVSSFSINSFGDIIFNPLCGANEL